MQLFNNHFTKFLMLASVIMGCSSCSAKSSTEPSAGNRSDEQHNAAEANLQEIQMTKPVPNAYFKPAKQKGSVEKLEYNSKDYTKNSKPVTHKVAFVYLPHNYDASKQYDIVYLIHGWTGVAEEYFEAADSSLKNLFDNMIEHDDIKPFIAVSPMWDKDNRAKDWGESVAEIAVFYNEYENDLIPAVEGKYSTFAKSTDHAGIVASRAHRAFGGFSLGSVTTWYIFENRFDLQKYFLPMSGDSWHIEMFGGHYEPEATAAYLATVVNSSKFKDGFHVYHAVGTSDSRFYQTHNQALACKKLPEFPPERYSYHQKDGGHHDLNSVFEFCYNALPEFFGK